MNKQGTVASATGGCWANIGYGIEDPPVVVFGGGDDGGGVALTITVCLDERRRSIWVDDSRGCSRGAGVGA